MSTTTRRRKRDREDLFSCMYSLRTSVLQKVVYTSPFFHITINQSIRHSSAAAAEKLKDRHGVFKIRSCLLYFKLYYWIGIPNSSLGVPADR